MPGLITHNTRNGLDPQLWQYRTALLPQGAHSSGFLDNSLGPAAKNGRHGCRECVPGLHDEDPAWV
jgi:hypothetical protein